VNWGLGTGEAIAQAIQIPDLFEERWLIIARQFFLVFSIKKSPPEFRRRITKVCKDAKYCVSRFS
jgi:hypothetical protein